MNKNNRAPILLFALLSALVLAWGCKSTPPPIEQELSPTEFFQKAQEASDASRYGLAIKYYEAFLSKYPDERERGIWARYEIALLNYKMGDEVTALRLFDELLALYAGDSSELPPGPKILAEKLKTNIESQRKAP
jgi:outer membrane protein assembly factor BamD (BamD/ComL family)